MSDEALMVLKMVQEGKITPEQGIAFLEALKPTSGQANSSSSSSSSSDGSSWSSVSQMQRRLAELQQRLGEMQAKLGAAQAGGSASSTGGSGSVKLPFGLGEFNINDVIDDAVKGINQIKSEASIGAKRAARQAQKEARRFRQEAEKMGKTIRVEVNFGFDTSDRPKNSAGLPEVTIREDRTVNMPVSGVVSLCNPFGDLKITGTSADDKIHVQTEKTVWASTRAECEEKVQRVELASGDTGEPGNGCDLHIEVGDNPSDHVAVTMTVQVPARAQVDARTSFGELHCESLEGGTRRIQTASGDIRLLHVYSTGEMPEPATINTASGDVAISQWKGRALQIDSVNGDIQIDMLDAPKVTVHTHSGDVTVQNAVIAGDFSAQTVSGDLHLEDLTIAGQSLTKTQSGDIAMEKLAAKDINLETVSGDVEAVGSTCPDGRATLKSISGDIEAVGLSAREVSLGTTSGDGEITFADGFDGLAAGVTVSGDLTVKFSADLHAKLTMNTHSGTLKSTYPLTDKEGNGQQYLSGKIGDGTAATITLQSVSGDLCIDKKD